METEASHVEAAFAHPTRRVFLSRSRNVPAIEPSHINARTLPDRPRALGIADAFALARSGNFLKIAAPVDEHVVNVHAAASVGFARKVEHHAQASPAHTSKSLRSGGVERLRAPEERYVGLRHGLHQPVFFAGVEDRCPGSGKRRLKKQKPAGSKIAP